MSSERQREELRRREERDTALAAEALKPLRGIREFDGLMNRAIVATVDADVERFNQAVEALVVFVEERAPDFARLQLGEDRRRFVTQAVLARSRHLERGGHLDDAIRRYTLHGTAGTHLPANEGRIRRGGAPVAEITPDLSVREQRELLAYIALFRPTDPGRPRTDEGEWLRQALVAHDALCETRSEKKRRGDITEEQLAEKLAIEVRSLQRWFKRCGVSFRGFLKLPS